MEAVQKNHLAIIKAQASTLWKEVKRSRPEHDSTLLADAVLPTSFQKRCGTASEKLHSIRIIDNFEVTLLHLLDKDGLIKEKHRLGTIHHYPSHIFFPLNYL